jgi:outer membrane lipoprotein-sorting protein
MKRLLLLPVLLLSATILPAAQNVAEILAKAATACNSPGGLTASFTLHTKTPQASESFEGLIYIKGNRFMLSTPDVKTWYDGATQWAYVEHTEEVNLSTPEGDELQFTNPAILLASYQKNFTATYKGEATGAGKNLYVVGLAPKKQSHIAGVELRIEKSTNLPVYLLVEWKNKTTNTIRISQLKTDANLSDSFFTFPQAQYPQAEIIDLR